MKKVFNIICIITGAILLLSIFSLFWSDNKKMGNGYVYYADNKMISSSDGLYGEIPSVVSSFDYDNNFIIAEQKPIENDPNALLYDFEYKYIEGYNTNYYWLIIKKEKKVIGPMNKDEFNKQRNKYNVSIKLTFK
jgi:hypothetical protein